MQKIDYSCKNNKKNIKEKHFNRFYETIHKKGAVCLIFKKINKHMQKIVNKTKIKTNYKTGKGRFVYQSIVSISQDSLIVIVSKYF